MGVNVLDRFSRHYRLLAMGLVAPLVAALILLPLRNSLTSAALLMVLVVVGVASTGDRLAGFLAALSAGLWFDFILTPKHATAADVQTTLVLLLVGVAVTEIAHRGAEAAKHANRMAAVVEYSGDAIIGRGLDDAITSWNPAAERILGYSSQEIIGKPAGVLIPEDRAGEANVIGAEVSAGKSVEHLETTRVRKDGTVIPVSLTVSPIRDAGGTIDGASTIARDVTEQRQALETAQRLASIVEGSQDAIISLSPEGLITSWNPAAERMNGYSAEEIVGKPISLLHPEGQSDDVDTILAKIAAGRPVEYNTHMHVRKDGTVFPVTLTVSPIRNADGAIVGTSTVHRDRTEQVQAERALAEASLQYQLLAENASDLVVMTSPDRVIRWVSPSLTRSLGWAVEDLMGKRLLDLVHPDDAAATAGPREGAYLGHEVTTPEGGFLMRFRTKSGQYRWMSGVATPVTDESGVVTGVVSGLRDVEDLVRAREEAQGLSSALQASNDSLRDFVAVASHDLRSPLVTIGGFAKILTNNWAKLSEEDRLEQLGAIKRGVDRLSRLTNDLLTSAKVEDAAAHTQPEHIRLATALASYLEADREELGTVAVTCPPELVAVVDPAHLTRILDNYLGNAFKYGEPPISIEAERVGDFVELRVRDHGSGVPPEFVSRLFTKFDRADTPTTRATQGTGLGLSIVKALAEANHGDARYQQDEPNAGCFVVRLPAGAA
jgi:PAS domain S-box-containing protein